MSVKGDIVNVLCGVAAMPPLSSAAERLLLLAGHRFPTSRTVQSFARHFGARLMRREREGFERIVTFDSGGRMHCGPDERVGLPCLMHYFLGTITGQMEDERPIVRLFDRLIRPGDVFFDVGANLGFYSLYMGPLCGTSGAVHAFEANPVLIPHLRRSIKLNEASSKIILNDVAVGRQSNTHLPLYDPDRIGNSSFHAHGWLDQKKWIKVPVVALDDYVRDQKIARIDAMKIDIEGAELEALQGMEKTFESAAPSVIACELMPSAVSSRAQSAARPGDIAAFLHERNYIMCAIADADGRLRLPALSVASIERETHVVNVAFVQSRLVRERPELFIDEGSRPSAIAAFS